MPTPFQKRLASVLVALLTCLCTVCVFLGLNKAATQAIASDPGMDRDREIRELEKAIEALREHKKQELEKGRGDRIGCDRASIIANLRFSVAGVVWIDEKDAFVACKLVGQGDQSICGRFGFTSLNATFGIQAM